MKILKELLYPEIRTKRNELTWIIKINNTEGKLFKLEKLSKKYFVLFNGKIKESFELPTLDDEYALHKAIDIIKKKYRLYAISNIFK